MKGIKALAEDCAKYVRDWKPNGPIMLSLSQLEELENSRSTKPFTKLDNGTWIYNSPSGKAIKIKPLKIGHGEEVNDHE